jgi:beta-lactamase regulating signal transducer with metallopeptidase domain
MGWLNGWLQGVLLAAGVAFLLRLVRMNAATRYWLWLATLVAVVGLQVTGGWRAPDPVVIEDAPVLAVPVPAPRGDWLLLVPVVWGLVGLALVARLAWGYRCVLRLVREAAPAPEPWQERLEHWRQLCGASRAVRLCASADARAPLSFGLTDPVIVLPASHLEALSGDEVDHVILHELAHVERHDDWTKLFQRLVEAVLFFHPAVLWMGRRLQLEREIACDEWAVAITGERRSYALCLTHLAEMAAGPSGAEGVLGTGFTTRQLSRRIEMLLETGRHWSRGASKLVLVAGLAVLAGVAVVAGQVAPLVPAASPQEDRVEARLREMQERLERNMQDRLRAMEIRLREMEEQLIARLKEERVREVEKDLDVEKMVRKIESLAREKELAVEPKVREMEKEVRKLHKDAAKELELQMRELEKKMREKARRRYPEI